MKNLFLIISILYTSMAFSQISSEEKIANKITNNTLQGLNVWDSIEQSIHSDNKYAISSLTGTTNILEHTGFDFSLSPSDSITGIEVRVEKKSFMAQDVQLAGLWSFGNNGPMVPLGLNRCLIVFIGKENGSSANMTSFKYGNVEMTRLISTDSVSTFEQGIDVFYLLEDSLQNTSGTSFEMTFDDSTQIGEYYLFSSAFFQNVDQKNTFIDVALDAIGGNMNPFSISDSCIAEKGSMALASIFCGTNTTPNSLPGLTNSYMVNEGFIEGIDQYGANVAQPANGSCMLSAYKPIDTDQKLAPTFNFQGSPNKQAVVLLTLRKARSYDDLISLRKANGYVGNNYAHVDESWIEGDLETVYGGPNDLWGTTWSYHDLNDSLFGIGLSADILNGAALIDHMSITVYYVEDKGSMITDFHVEPSGTIDALCMWDSHKEVDLDKYIVLRSRDSIQWEYLGEQNATGTISTLTSYNLLDQETYYGLNYYKLLAINIYGDTVYTDVDTYSRIASSDEDFSDPIIVYPNPAKDETNVKSEEKLVDITLIDATGRIINHYEIDENNPFIASIDLNFVAEASYILLVKTEESNERIKIFKSH